MSVKGILHSSKNKNNFNILVPHTIKYLDQHEVISNKFFINLDLSDLSRAFLKAFVFGIKDELDTSHKRIFINSGTMHLFAVSGLHVGCLFIAIFSICKILGSAHNVKEIRIKESQQVKLIFISSLLEKLFWSSIILFKISFLKGKSKNLDNILKQAMVLRLTPLPLK